MALIPSLRRALARMLGKDGGHAEGRAPDASPMSASSPASPSSPSSPSSSPSATPSVPVGSLIPVGNHVIFASAPREAERALLLMMDGAGEELRVACQRALQAVRGGAEETAA